MAYVIIADGEIDQIVDTKAQATEEKADLQDMGCTVHIKRFSSWLDAEAFADHYNAD